MLLLFRGFFLLHSHLNRGGGQITEARLQHKWLQQNVGLLSLEVITKIGTKQKWRIYIESKSSCFVNSLYLF